ncbi:Cof-type HAD-IIB family hydrolase [Psychromonas aquimarina]|uniref:Cof-type HAD-IIB family hydrolase n=1 Tax=Psychromonas aquimarina TaxID=444919 RepID=UPI0003F4BB69|nr:Cof-type HAD-IIB family hydrolase [Psychromonas aquimarina]
MTYQKVKAVASDLDGTLLTADNRIGAYTRKTLRTLHQQEIHFIVATGRHYLDAKYIRDSTAIPAYMITSNGARIHDKNDQLIYRKDVDPDVVKSIAAMLKDDSSITLNLFTENAWLASKDYADTDKYHPDSGFTYQLFDKAAAPTENVAKLSVSHPCGDYLAKLEKSIISSFSGRANIYLSTPTNLEVTAAGTSKGQALQIIAQRHKHKLEHYMAFGDAMNDLEMLQMSGFGLIMAEGQKRLIKCLPNNEVIGCSADQAVAEYIQKHLL